MTKVTPDSKQSTQLSRNSSVSVSNDKKRRTSQHYHGPSLRQLKMRITCDDPSHPGLKKIKLSGKELTNLPMSLFDLIELQVLELSPEREACLHYHLSSVPPQISKLRNLTVLAVDTNTLSELPEALCELAQLQRLALSNNLLKGLPQNFSKLTSLQSLYCANNQFHEFPIELTELSSLVFLDLSDNQIERIPDQIGEMTCMESLILSYNSISVIPDTISNLKNLEMLWLCGNDLTILPKGLSSLPRLDWNWMLSSSALDGNPLEHPPMSIARQGPAAIDKYLSLYQSNTHKPLDRKVPKNSNKALAI